MANLAANIPTISTNSCVASPAKIQMIVPSATPRLPLSGEKWSGWNQGYVRKNTKQMPLWNIES